MNKQMEFIWRASPSLGASSQLFTSILYDGSTPAADDDGFSDRPRHCRLWAALWVLLGCALRRQHGTALPNRGLLAPLTVSSLHARRLSTTLGWRIITSTSWVWF